MSLNCSKNGENVNSLCAEEWKDESKVCSDGSQVFSVLYNDNNWMTPSRDKDAEQD